MLIYFYGRIIWGLEIAFIVHFHFCIVWEFLHSYIVRVFANCPGDRSSISGRVIQKTQKMVLDTILPNTQHYKLRIKGKVKQSRE